MRYIIIGLVFVLGGCESMPRGEWAYLGVHTVDVLQTYNTAVREPECFQESGPIVSRLIGENPSSDGVIAWAVGFGLLHYGVSALLENKAPEWASVTWQGLTIGGTTLSAMRNHQAGARPWGDNRYRRSSGCY